MKKDKFDDLIKDKLNNLSPPYGAEDWSVFEKLLGEDNESARDIENEQFDHKVKTELSKVNPIFNSNHWSLFKEQLKLIESRKKTITITKFLEFAAILLIVFTFLNISGYQEYDKIFPDQKEQYAYTSTSNSISASKFNQCIESKFGAENYVKKVGTESKNNFPHLIKRGKRVNTDAGKFFKIEGELVSDLGEESKITLTSLELANLLKSELLNIEAIDLRSHFVPLKSEDNVLTVDQVPFTEMLPLKELNPLYSEMALSFPMESKRPNSRPRIAVSGYFTADINLINTPFDKLYSLASYNKEALNNSYGIHLSTIKNNLEIETGLGYSKRIYQPEIVTEAFGQFGNNYFEKSLTRISFDIINVPLNLKYHFINSNHWSIYLMGGIAMNLVVNADYNIVEALRSGSLFNRFTPEQARLDEKTFTPGLFNAGAFRDNYFASVCFGFGIEKKITQNVSLYVQPSYQRHMLSADIGIGPNKDKIHTASLQFGVKTFLN